jgi:hypothetical protein
VLFGATTQLLYTFYGIIGLICLGANSVILRHPGFFQESQAHDYTNCITACFGATCNFYFIPAGSVQCVSSSV